MLKERLGGNRIHFTDAERRRLARKAHALGRKALNELETLVTPDTQLRSIGRLENVFVASSAHLNCWRRSSHPDPLPSPARPSIRRA